MAAALGSGGDSAWMLASSALVLLMTPGLAFFYGGLVRDVSIINTMMMSIIAMGVISVLWALVGFSLAFGDGGPVIGNFDFAVLDGLDGKTWGDTDVWSLAIAVFQMTFAIIAAAILSGSLVERIRFQAYIIFIVLWSLFVYVPICHWVWAPGGWMDNWGALDFAGGTVVHVSSGTSGLVAAALLGPRTHKASTEDKPHNVPFVLLGAALLWFGWGGFNGGSAFAADAVAARALATTYLSASASMLVWTVMDSIRFNQISSVGAMVGAVAGLVVITPAAGFVSPQGAITMGVLGAPVCYCAVVLMGKLKRIDDALDAFALHGIGGCWGAILTGLFSMKGGLFYNGGWALLGKQVVCCLVGAAYAAGVTALIFIVLKAVMRVRVLDHVESSGVDQHVHGEKAYSPAKSYALPRYTPNQTSVNEESGCVNEGSDGAAGVGARTDVVTV